MNCILRLQCLPVLFCLAAAFSACKVDPNDDPAVVVTADPEFSVDLFEQRNPTDGTPLFGLWVESMDKYDCEGYGIDATVALETGRIEVNLLGVTAPTPCTGDPAPARQFLPIGNLPDGVYTFVLSLRDAIVNEGVLTVLNGHFELSLPNAQGVDFQNMVLEHLPDDIAWGYVAIPNEMAEPVADAFITDLKKITTDPGLPPGFYSYFTVSGTGQITFHKSIAPGVVSEQFVRRFNGTGALKSLLFDYRSDPQLPLSIRCWTPAGEL